MERVPGLSVRVQSQLFVAVLPAPQIRGGSAPADFVYAAALDHPRYENALSLPIFHADFAPSRVAAGGGSAVERPSDNHVGGRVILASMCDPQGNGEYFVRNGVQCVCRD